MSHSNDPKQLSPSSTQHATEDERPNTDIAIEFGYRLKDLTFNDAIVINKLMHFARDNIKASAEIAALVEDRISKSTSHTQRLATLYLMDSIIKNVGRAYKTIFARDLVNTYCSSFEAVDDTVRISLLKLYNTWSVHFEPALLEQIQQRLGNEEMARIGELIKLLPPKQPNKQNVHHRQSQPPPQTKPQQPMQRPQQPPQQPMQQPQRQPQPQPQPQQPMQQFNQQQRPMQPFNQSPLQQPQQQQMHNPIHQNVK
ncbi:hypothetical protein SAMD00019534_038670 [Acytostelium subglobosum LB1]|uniref:hypothetical protein n=1 Tax=Acytostelium subglobosum LB1 TaxID=1410327 RepID=UPI0006448B40|nr:hypothetical protein SAMD00019534_038670 [Acytostelium subglobosum LB1]GAM20692.1 hypothetical protein SAMD00019534_038670 [Acytostelium subglobosum LB1]|eukprot:XP_012760213.1 hypothetical protein SAMD00019534_038670 [Acytostelium subglobosum LB1]